MATLLLTAVGGLIGGRIGGAVGAIAGQVIDNQLLGGGRGREGPRLTDLSVQTSSYGDQIPRVFGTMRVAGSVIWSTDLIESRSRSSGGKGQPSVTQYSYSASFAVLLSARAVQRVGRIWADGKLLRGAGGDFKTSTGFRLHLGGEGQPVDPLIASAEGAMAPAHRGYAYAVFEHFQLADYGNRIPSLTFELVAEEAPVAIGAIAAELSDGVVAGAGADATLPGFSAYGDSARGVLDALAEIDGGWFAPVGSGFALRSDARVDRTIVDQGAGTRSRGVRRRRTIAAIETVPKTITLTHYDPARDYQIGLQRTTRPGAGNRSTRIEAPAAIAAGPAKAIAQTALLAREAGRETRQVALDWGALDVLPGAVVAIADEAGAWRVTGWSLEAMVLTLDLRRLGGTVAEASASSGRLLANPDAEAGQTILAAFELPSLDDNLLSMPRVLVAAAGSAPGWRRAALLYSLDDGARWIAAGPTALPAVIGTVVVPPRTAGSALRDLAGSIEVELAHAGMVLADADDAALDGGANLALVRDELVQFGHAEMLAPTRWRLSRLLRGRRGTEAAAGAQRVGDRFVLIEAEALVAIDLPLSAVGSVASVMASGIGDGAGPVRVDASVSGASVVPPAPVRLGIKRDATGAAQLNWVRRSRAGWRWNDGVDAPLGEEREAYRVEIGARAIEAAAPGVALAEDEAGAVIAVRQIGTHGASAPTTLA